MDHIDIDSSLGENIINLFYESEILIFNQTIDNQKTISMHKSFTKGNMLENVLTEKDK